ncbi:MAG TPA: TIGR04283 family arsenosugar biosynthesis glycosyltransferase [Rhodoplanes sp.]|nr:TIGR04283 family arsenosugar biosynthesis glycosyltransferase [Rhodoplanes sp.]
MRLSIIIPVLDEEAEIAHVLAALAPLRSRGVETIVVDGGSRDRTVALAAPLADRVITAPRGRAVQMNTGAVAATGDVLLFLHADTRLPAEADRLVLDGLARSGRQWGRFDVRISGRHPLLRVVAALMNIRSRLTGIATGDQAMFVRRDLFERVGGFPAIPLMEDVAFSRAAKRVGEPLCLSPRAITSGRRWEQRGVMRTILLMWRLRLAYSLGAAPARLAHLYGYAAPPS